MLKITDLSARVTAPARSTPRSFRMTQKSRDLASTLRFKGSVAKTTTRVTTDGLMAALDVLVLPNGRVAKEPAKVLRGLMGSTDGMTTTKVQLSLSDDYWHAVEALASYLDVGPSHVVRVLGDIAMEQAYDELSGR